MKLNNCDNRVLSAKQSRTFRPIVWIVLILVLATSIAVSSCRHVSIGNQPNTSTENRLTTPEMKRSDENPLLLPENKPIENDEAAAIALTLDQPLEVYDALRPGGAANLAEFEKVTIERVVDGDTMMVVRGAHPVKLRLIGINTPESYSHHEENARTHRGESVSRIVKHWLNGRTVYLQFDKTTTDPYDRLLAYAWLDAHTMVNEVLVREGLAEERRYEPTTHFNDYFETLEKIAQEEKRGIWSQSSGHKENHMNKKIIYLAGGCFWGVERYYQILGKGVLDIETGYANGTTEDPTYAEVCSGTTGFAETVKLTYDADVLTLNEIMAHFFRIIDPTTRDRQGNDVGTQYRPGVYYESKDDFEVVCDYIDFRRKDYRRPIVVEVLELQNYYSAEEYHQNYLKNEPSGYCHVNLSLVDEPLRSEELPDDFKEPVNSGSILPPSLFEKDAIDNRDGDEDKPRYTRPDDATIKDKLSDLQYRVTQEDYTERPFDNEFDAHYEQGIYVDIVSGEPLFSSRDKYDAGCGWPAFTKPIARGMIEYREDKSLWRKRVEVRSSIADSHLGHVFPDGPREFGGQRYCINSAALRFIPLAEMEREGYGDWIAEVVD